MGRDTYDLDPGTRADVIACVKHRTTAEGYRDSTAPLNALDVVHLLGEVTGTASTSKTTRGTTGDPLADAFFDMAGDPSCR